LVLFGIPRSKPSILEQSTQSTDSPAQISVNSVACLQIRWSDADAECGLPSGNGGRWTALSNQGEHWPAAFLEREMEIWKKLAINGYYYSTLPLRRTGPLGFLYTCNAPAIVLFYH